MRSHTRTGLFSLVLLFVFLNGAMMFFPERAFAAGLVPCGRTEDDLSTPNINEAAKCTLCHLILGGKGIIDWGRTVMVVVGITVITAMGILYIISAGDEGLMSTAKGGIKAALIGIAVMLSAWLIVNVVLTFLTTYSSGTSPVRGLVRGNGFQFSCDLRSSAATPGGAATPAGGTAAPAPATGGSGGAPCTDPEPFKNALNSGQKVCSIGSYTCPSCDTTPWNAEITAAANKYSIDHRFIRTMIARESTCRANPGPSVDGKSCGIMQVKFADLGNSNCTTPINLNDVATNIDKGAEILSRAVTRARAIVGNYGGTVTEYELAAAIYNGGSDDSATSGDCTPATGWKTIPKWGCPINPGTAEYNACDIKQYACTIGKCF